MKRFWLVIKQNEHGSIEIEKGHRHHTKKSAKTEAERLILNYGLDNEVYYVMKSTAMIGKKKNIDDIEWRNFDNVVAKPNYRLPPIPSDGGGTHP